MFQALSQGAVVSLLYRNEPRVVDGRVVSVSTHMPLYNPSQPMAVLNGPVTDITVQVGNETIPFLGLPANGVVANFPEKGLFIATDKSAVLKEVESISLASKQVLEQAPAAEKMIAACDAILIEHQPEKRKEAEQAKEIEGLKTQLESMNGKFEKVMQLLSAKLG